MPLQFRESGVTVYTINYKQLMNNLCQIKLFKDHAIQKIYFEQWEIVLKQAEKEDLKDYYPYYRLHGLNDQYFAYQFFLGEQECFLHFNVSKLMSSPILTSISSENIPVKKFSDPYSDIFWKKPADGKHSQTPEKPIIIIPLYIGTYHHMVIDGNHRIQEALEKSADTILCQYIDILPLLASETFLTRFDHLFYGFLCELTLMTLEENSDDMSLLKESYLHYRYHVFDNIQPTSQTPSLPRKWFRKILSSFPWNKEQ